MSLKINIQKDSGTNAVTKSVVVGSGKAITPTGSGIIEATNLLGTIDASQVSTGTLDPARLPLGLGTDTTPANGKLLIGNGSGYTAANLTAGTNISITNSAGGITINNTMPSGLIYQGAWDALTNTPTLTSSVGTQGYYYVVSVAGTTNLNGVTDWQVGDWAIFNGTVWQKIDNTDQVTSVFGRQGAVVATSGDYTASQVTNIPYAGIVATNVQAAINELYDDIQATEQALTAYVTNAESFSITRGQVVYLYGAQGDRASVKLASNLSDATSAKTFGVVADASIAANGAGYIRCQGVVSNLNLGAYQPGDTLYLGATPGSVTATKPYAPNHLVYVGIVERANNGNGLLYVKIQNGYELDEIHDVQITAPKLAGQTLLYDATNSLWKNARLTAGTGMTLTFADASVTLTPNFSAPPVIGNTTPNVVNATTLNATDVAATYGTFTGSVTTPYVKADTGVYLTLQGGSTGASLVLGLGANGQATFDRKLNLAASTTSAASLNVPQGTAPTTPTNGDIWTTSTGLYARINGSTVGPFGSGTVTSVSGTANQVTVSPTTGDVVVSLPSQLVISGQSLTSSSATSLLDLSTTWNTTGNPTALKLNVTNTASGSTSNLLDLQVGGVSQFQVTKAGVIVFGTDTSLSRINTGLLAINDSTNSQSGLYLRLNGVNKASYTVGSSGTIFDYTAPLLIRQGIGGTSVLTLTSTQQVQVNSTTASTSTSTGALIVNGGLGVAKNVYFGATSGTVAVFSNSTVTIGQSSGSNLGVSTFGTIDVQDSNDSTLRLWRSQNEHLTFAAARGGKTGANNQFQIDVVGPNSGQARPLIFRSSYDGGTTMRNNLVLLPFTTNSDSSVGQFKLQGGTITDISTAASGTNARLSNAVFEASTFAATNTGVITTNASTVYISGGPNAGTNQTLTNSWGLWNAGATRLDGIVLFGGNATRFKTDTNGRLQLSTSTSANLGIFGNAGGGYPDFGIVPQAVGARGLVIQGNASQTADLFDVQDSTNAILFGVGPSGIVSVNNTTESSSTTTGALVVSGGLGVAKTITAGGVIVNKAYTVATLPAAASYTYGTCAVSDAINAAGTGLGISPTGGGSVKRLVYSDGSNWLLL